MENTKIKNGIRMSVIHNTSEYGFPILIRNGVRPVRAYYQHALRVLHDVGIEHQHMVGITIDVDSKSACILFENKTKLELYKDEWVAYYARPKHKAAVYLSSDTINRVNKLIK